MNGDIPRETINTLQGFEKKITKDCFTDYCKFGENLAWGLIPKVFLK